MTPTRNTGSCSPVDAAAAAAAKAAAVMIPSTREVSLPPRHPSQAMFPAKAEQRQQPTTPHAFPLPAPPAALAPCDFSERMEELLCRFLPPAFLTHIQNVTNIKLDMN